MLRQQRRAVGGRDDLLEMAPQRAPRRYLEQAEIRVVGDRGEDVVEIVGNPPGETADCLHFVPGETAFPVGRVPARCVGGAVRPRAGLPPAPGMIAPARQGGCAESTSACSTPSTRSRAGAGESGAFPFRRGRMAAARLFRALMQSSRSGWVKAPSAEAGGGGHVDAGGGRLHGTPADRRPTQRTRRRRTRGEKNKKVWGDDQGTATRTASARCSKTSMVLSSTVVSISNW